MLSLIIAWRPFFQSSYKSPQMKPSNHPPSLPMLPLERGGEMNDSDLPSTSYHQLHLTKSQNFTQPPPTPKSKLLSIHHFHISHISPHLPPNFAKSFFVHLFQVLQPSQEKFKTTVMHNFGGQIRCIVGNVEVAIFYIAPLINLC